jgi:trehalose 6-phosphate synthase/phosphatase
VPQYAELKREIDELVSTTNGAFGTLGWNPIWYYFRPAPFEHLSAFYAKADVLLVTPLRDGMNLISKEYIAARRDRKGVVVLSETAGSSRELGETLIVNPNDIESIADAIYEALNLPEDVQQERNERLHKRLARYDIHYWAQDFIDKLNNVAQLLKGLRMKKLTASVRKEIAEHFTSASSRLLFIDFDGTLTSRGEEGRLLDEETRSALSKLAEHPDTEVVIVSGRQRADLEKRFEDMSVNIIAGHGIWRRDRKGQWHLEENVSSEWKDVIRPMFDLFQDRTPGSRVEEHEYSLMWYFDKAQPELAAIRLNELRDALLDLTANHELSVLESSRSLEIKSATASKGRAASHWYHLKDWDFVIALGDDWTDEEIFSMLDDSAYSVKVGVEISSAKFFLDSVRDVRDLVVGLSDKA